MIPKNLPASIPQMTIPQMTAPSIERAREAVTAAISVPVGLVPTPSFICNAPTTASSVASASFNNENSARLHVRQLKSEMGQTMDAMDQREAKARDTIHNQRVMLESNFTAIRNSIDQAIADCRRSFLTGK